MTIPGLLLRAYGGYQQGRQQRQDRDYAEQQDRQQRADRLSELAAQRQAQMDARAEDARRYAEQQARQQAQDQRSAFEGGYDPAAQVEARGRDLASNAWQAPGGMIGQAGQLALGGMSTQRAKEPPAFSIAGQAFVRGRESLQEKRDRVNDEANAQLKREAIAQSAATAEANRIAEGKRTTETNDTRKEIAAMVAASKGGQPPVKLKPAPMGAIKDYNGLQSITRDIDMLGASMQTPEGSNAVGLKNFMPDIIMGRMDKKGIPTRQMLANFSSLTFLERSGAAVTPSEAERLKPYLLNSRDSAEAIRTKLGFIKSFLDDRRQRMEDSYNEETGYQPLSRKLGPPQSVAPPTPHYSPNNPYAPRQ